MARAIYPHELSDQDFSWLINNFLENHPDYMQLDGGYLPVVLIQKAFTDEAAVPMTDERDVEAEGDERSE